MDPIHASIYGPDLWIRSVGPIRDGPVTGQRRAGDELVTGWCMGRACGVGHQGFVIHLFEIHLFEFCTLCIYIYVYICLASCVSVAVVFWSSTVLSWRRVPPYLLKSEREFSPADRVFRCIAYRVYAGSRIYPDGIRRFELTSLVLLLIYTRVCFLPGLGLFIRASRGVSFCWNDKSTHCSSTKMAIDSRSPWFDVAKLQFVEKPTGSLTDVSPRLMMSSHTHCL